MIIKKLTVAGLRGFNQAEFNFLPGMNLLVGVNGVGKTTALDALRICASKVLPDLTVTTSLKQPFMVSDISIGFPTMQVSCDFAHQRERFNLLVFKQREAIIRRKSESGITELPDVEKISPDIKTLFPEAKSSINQPLVVYFSTRRSLVENAKVSNTSVSGGQAAAFAESLLPNRAFNLYSFAHWLRAQEMLAKEKPEVKRHIRILEKAVKLFLPSMRKLVVEMDERNRYSLFITKGKVKLDVSKHLSDGERGVLSIVLDIARRLSQANPGLKNPLRNGRAIILIDELDLHLHPKWQRTIVENLINTFPKCQFIVTTHSPQIIPSVETERIQLISNDDVFRPDRTFGMDSNWILRHLMEADERPQAPLKAIAEVEKSIDEGKFATALKQMSAYKNQGWDLPEWSVLEARIARLKILGKKK